MHRSHSLRARRWATMQSRALPTRNGSTPISISRLGVAGGVVGVQGGEHQVPGQGGLDGDGGCLPVPDLTDQHDVGVGPQDRSQRGGEGHARLDIDLDLVDPVELVLDGVLDRDDVLGRAR